MLGREARVPIRSTIRSSRRRFAARLSLAVIQ
jgi:hypothetical protein